jgi:hypothetical protein
LNCSQYNLKFYEKLGFYKHDIGMRYNIDIWQIKDTINFILWGPLTSIVISEMITLYFVIL